MELNHEPSITAKPVPSQVPSQEVFVVTLSGLDDNNSATVKAISIFTSLAAANKDIDDRAKSFESQIAELKVTMMLLARQGFQPWMTDGGLIKEKGKGEDGREYWMATRMGTSTLPSGLQREDLIKCETSKSMLRLESEWPSSSGAENRAAFVVVVHATVDKQAEITVEGVFVRLEDANAKVRDLGAEYNEGLNKLARSFGWGDNAYFTNGKASSDGVSHDGGFFWAGVRKWTGDRAELAYIKVYKRILDEVQMVEGGEQSMMEQLFGADDVVNMTG